MVISGELLIYIVVVLLLIDLIVLIVISEFLLLLIGIRVCFGRLSVGVVGMVFLLCGKWMWLCRFSLLW